MSEKIKAVYASEVQTFFTRLGLLAKLSNGELQCCSCGTAITLVNFGSVYKKEGRLIFTCNCLICIGTSKRCENSEELLP